MLALLVRDSIHILHKGEGSVLHFANGVHGIFFCRGGQVSLNLSNNRLSELPKDIGRLCGLEELFVQYNFLTSLPVSGPPAWPFHLSPSTHLCQSCPHFI